MNFLGTRCSPCRIRSGGLAYGCSNAETPGHLTNVKTCGASYGAFVPRRDGRN
ncbi:hypothetical protein OKW46_001022 [Paraburkholderia sp. WSM4179]|nr:hypothetical protein [Paraburkholderia sp. WSM4179]